MSQRRVIAADVLDSRRNDWTITDDSIDRGPIRTWPAPVLKRDDRTPATYQGSKLTRSGLPDAYGFLRGKLDQPKLSVDDFPDEETPPWPQADAMGLPQYRTVPRPLVSFDYDIPGIDRYQAGMLVSFLRRTDAGALDGWAGRDGAECRGLYNRMGLDDAGMPKSWYDGISAQENRMVALLRAVGGAKFSTGNEKEIRDGFVGIRSHATDSSKWTPFNKTKERSFQILGYAQPSAPKYTWNAPKNAEQKQLQTLWNELEAHVNSQGGGMLSFVGKGLSSVGSTLGDVGKGVVSVGKGIVTPVAALVTSPVKLASDIASGKNVFESLKDTVKRDLSSAKDLAPYVQAAISVIPVGGTLVSGAISAGAALAQGQPITSAIVDGLKNSLPGGPIAASAFDAVYAVARGENVGDAALQALVNNAPGGEVGKRAAMAAVAVAKGQNLQQAALGAAKGAALSLIPGNVPNVVKDVATQIVEGQNVVNAATTALGSEAMARFSPLAKGVLDNTGPRIANMVSQQLPAILPTDARLVAQSLLQNPTLRSMPIEDVARKLGVSTNVVREGMGAVLQAAQKSGGAGVPSLSNAKDLAARIPMGMSFDRGLAVFGSKAAPITYSHNVTPAQRMSPARRAAALRRAGGVFHALQARGLDCGALDPTKMATIRQGSTDASSAGAVSQWQKIVGVVADGKFGPNTHAATVAFQKKSGLTADGIVGPKTWAAGLIQVVTTTPPATVPGTTIPVATQPPATSAPIIAKDMPTIREGSTGAAVKTWQAFLAIPADGIFGPQTKAATIAFQTKNGLVADGIVGPKTWEKAMGGTATPITPPPIIVSTPPVSIPPITLPPIIPGTPPITTPPVNIPPVVVSTPPSLPPGLPPVVTTPPAPPNPPGQPPSPPPITTTPPGVPPVVTPPPGNTPPTKTAGTGLLIGAAVILGTLVLTGSGSSKRLL